MKHLISSLILVSFLVATPFLSAGEPVIVLVGDSTVAPDGGWGDGFIKLLKPGISCINLGQRGRSSKSYRDEGLWQKVIEAKPTWVLIQFGHNDQPGKGPKRETDPQTTYRENITRYVDEAHAVGAQAVLVTSLTRRNFDADGKISPDGLAPYVAVIKELAAEKHLALVDLNARSIELMVHLGPEKAAEFNHKISGKVKTPAPVESNGIKNPDAPGVVDLTHLSPKGEKETAALVASEVRANVPELAKLLAPAK